jgi:hypothetical protein
VATKAIWVRYISATRLAQAAEWAEPMVSHSISAVPSARGVVGASPNARELSRHLDCAWFGAVPQARKSGVKEIQKGKHHSCGPGDPAPGPSTRDVGDSPPMRNLSAEEARQIRQNLTGFFRLLADWDRAGSTPTHVHVDSSKLACRCAEC